MTTHTAGPRHNDMARTFTAFHVANPRVYQLLVTLTHEFVNRTGRDKLGFSLVYGAARWQYALETADGNSEYKLNNDYAPFYARLIMRNHPELGEVFDLRYSVADAWSAELGGPVSTGYGMLAVA